MIYNKFVRRLERIGVNVALRANYPWIYLDTVNGSKVTGEFMAEHGFTAFFSSIDGIRFSNRRAVFAKIRQMLAFEQYVILSQEISND